VFARFLALAEKGTPKELPPPGAGRGGGGGARGTQRTAGRSGPSPEAQAKHLADVEASVRWTQALLARL
jgi:hypothetical protein